MEKVDRRSNSSEREEVRKKRKNIVVRRRFHFGKMLVVLLPLIILVVIYFVFSPKIDLKGESVIKLSYQDHYEEKGATAKFLGKDVTSDIKRAGKVEENKVGEYKITYTVHRFLYHTTKTRTVKIVDEKKPTIELKGKKKISICPGKKYKEEGYTAQDEYDGDLTKKVERTEKKDFILYQVQDSSKNKTEEKREIRYQDDEKPAITLKGTDHVYVSLNSKYEDPGYTAEDNCDGDLSKQVKVDGSVNASKEGVYTVTYTVKDTGGNEAQVKRTVTVSKKTDPNSGEVKNGVIYLTFDDGPNASTTKDILDILKAEGVKATFFITNNGPDSLVKREYDEGHSVAIHTASHDFAKVYANEAAYFEDLKIVHDRIQRLTGQDTKIVRFPGGSSNTVSKRYNKGIMTRLTQALFDQGYRYYDWNVDGNDAGACASKPTNERANCVYTNVTKYLSKSKPNMVLMHDIKPYTRDALRDIIRFGKENGYTFEPVTMNTAMVRQRINN